MTYSIKYLLIIATLFAIYRRGYWISRRYYNLKVIKKNNISTTYSLISIINQIGVIISAYIGSLILDYVGIHVLTSISKKFYTLSKNFEYNNYNLVYEVTQNFFRSIVTFIFFVFNFELKTMIYITLIFVLLGIFLVNKKIPNKII